VDPPQNQEAERALLGSIFKDKEVLPAITELIIPSDFYNSMNEKIFEAILSLYNNNQPVDLITVNEELCRMGQDMIGAAYLAGLAEATSVNAEQYAKIIKDKSLTRQVARSCNSILSQIQSNDFENAEELLGKAESEIFSIGQKNVQGSLVSVRSFLGRHIDTIFERGKLKGITGISTEIKLMDAWTAGFQKKDLIIIAGRPSMGKTGLSVQIAKDAAIKNGHSVAIFSLEMSKEQVMDRLLSNEGRVDSHNIRVGQLNDEEQQRMVRAAARIDPAKIYIDDSGLQTVPAIRTRCRKLKSESGLDLVIIDYLQLMDNHRKTTSRQQDVSDISRGIKALAKELDAPVIAVSQLNRAVESRQDKKPTMSDLRESGSLEQDADLIMFIYRDEYYTKEKCKCSGVAEIIVAKQRNGPVGSFELGYLNPYTKFVNLEKHCEPPREWVK